MRMIGRARYRQGRNVPLIGFKTYGSVANNEKLDVPPYAINYGYTTRKPVEVDEMQPRNKEQNQLDHNHSHFILVNCLL